MDALVLAPPAALLLVPPVVAREPALPPVAALRLVPRIPADPRLEVSLGATDVTPASPLPRPPEALIVLVPIPPPIPNERALWREFQLAPELARTPEESEPPRVTPFVPVLSASAAPFEHPITSTLNRQIAAAWSLGCRMRFEGGTLAHRFPAAARRHSRHVAPIHPRCTPDMMFK